MLLRIALAAGLACVSTASLAQTYVQGYMKRDGTYVQGHTRSAPNATRSDNYGSAPRSQNSFGSSYSSPYSRDKDRDGISNQYDNDDDNDGKSDDYDSNP